MKAYLRGWLGIRDNRREIESLKSRIKERDDELRRAHIKIQGLSSTLNRLSKRLYKK